MILFSTLELYNLRLKRVFKTECYKRNCFSKALPERSLDVFFVFEHPLFFCAVWRCVHHEGFSFQRRKNGACFYCIYYIFFVNSRVCKPFESFKLVEWNFPHTHINYALLVLFIDRNIYIYILLRIKCYKRNEFCSGILHSYLPATATCRQRPLNSVPRWPL